MRNRIFRDLPWLLLGGLCLLAVSPAALADTYNIILKTANGTPVSCATGGFTFAKTTAGTYAVPVTVAVTGSCLNLQSGTYGTSLNVIVENVVLNGQDQGPNVVGLSGSLSRSTGSGTWTISFQYAAGSASTGSPNRTATYTDNNNQSITGSYDARNTLTVPEPGVLWLVLSALASLCVLRLIRRTA